MTEFGHAINDALEMYRLLSSEQITALIKIGFSAGRRMPEEYIRSVLIQSAQAGNILNDQDQVFKLVQSQIEQQNTFINRK